MIPPAGAELKSRSVPPGQSGSFYRLKQVIRRVGREGRHLLAQLEAGEGREKTAPTFLNLRALIRDAQEEGRRIFASDQLLSAAAGAQTAIIQLAPYYGQG